MASHTKARRAFWARTAVLTAVAGLTLGFAVAPAFADPGNGNGGPGAPQGNANGQANGNGGGSGNASTHQTQGTGATVGNPNQPQPPSNADFSGHGANTHGAYDSTRDGSPSLNGNGNGNAVGKPCAGCVGKADNKNPPGQFPDGSDANAGYECDRNNGIGKTNPAHTGCQTVPPTPPVPEVTPTPAPPPGELVSPVPVSLPSVPSVPVQVPARAARALAVTGGKVLYPLVVGLAALAVGGALMVLSRRRRLVRL